MAQKKKICVSSLKSWQYEPESQGKISGILKQTQYCSNSKMPEIKHCVKLAYGYTTITWCTPPHCCVLWAGLPWDMCCGRRKWSNGTGVGSCPGKYLYAAGWRWSPLLSQGTLRSRQRSWHSAALLKMQEAMVRNSNEPLGLRDPAPKCIWTAVVRFKLQTHTHTPMWKW